MDFTSQKSTFQTYTNGTNGTSPHIGEGGYWYIGTTNTGIKAQGADALTMLLSNDSDIIVRNNLGVIVGDLPTTQVFALQGANQIDNATFTETAPPNFEKGSDKHYTFENGLLTIKKIPDDFEGGTFTFIYSGISKSFSLKVVSSEVDYNLIIDKTLINSTEKGGTVKITVKKISADGTKILEGPSSEEGAQLKIGNNTNHASSWQIGYNKGDTTAIPVKLEIQIGDEWVVWDEETIEFVANGAPGTPGGDGVSLQVIYKKDTSAPTAPTGENPSGWDTSMPTISGSEKVYMSQKMSNQDTWSTPVQISALDGSTPTVKIENGVWVINGTPTTVQATGDPGHTPVITVGDDGCWYVDGQTTGQQAQGEPGKDGSDVQYIYYRSEGAVANLSAPTGSTTINPVPETITDEYKDAWYESPLGITEKCKYEYMSMRSKAAGTNTSWSNYTTPVIWSKWGDKGQDGDGVKYKYCLFTPTASNSKPIYPAPSNAYSWTDEPSGVSETNQYEYVVAIKSSPIVAVAKKINTDFREFTETRWKAYGTKGHEENWIIRKLYNPNLSLDNSHIYLGDYAYVEGATTDTPSQSVRLYGEVIDLINSSTAGGTIRMRTEFIIFDDASSIISEVSLWAKWGEKGEDSVAYWLQCSTPIISKAANGDYQTSSVTFTPMIQVGNSTPDICGSDVTLKIWKDSETDINLISTSNNGAKTINLGTGSEKHNVISALICKMYLNEVKVDEQTAEVLADGVTISGIHYAVTDTASKPEDNSSDWKTVYPTDSLNPPCFLHTRTTYSNDQKAYQTTYLAKDGENIKGDNGDSSETIFIYYRTANTAVEIPNISSSLSSSDDINNEWTSAQITPLKDFPYVFKSTGIRKTDGNTGAVTYSSWTVPELYSAHYGDGDTSPVDGQTAATFFRLFGLGKTSDGMKYDQNGNLYINAEMINTGALTVTKGGEGSDKNDVLFSAGWSKDGVGVVNLAGWHATETSLFVQDKDSNKTVISLNSIPTDWDYEMSTEDTITNQNYLEIAGRFYINSEGSLDFFTKEQLASGKYNRVNLHVSGNDMLFHQNWHSFPYLETDKSIDFRLPGKGSVEYFTTPISTYASYSGDSLTMFNYMVMQTNGNGMPTTIVPNGDKSSGALGVKIGWNISEWAQSEGWGLNSSDAAALDGMYFDFAAGDFFGYYDPNTREPSLRTLATNPVYWPRPSNTVAFRFKSPVYFYDDISVWDGKKTPDGEKISSYINVREALQSLGFKGPYTIYARSYDGRIGVGEVYASKSKVVGYLYGDLSIQNYHGMKSIDNVDEVPGPASQINIHYTYARSDTPTTLAVRNVTLKYYYGKLQFTLGGISTNNSATANFMQADTYFYYDI